MNWLSDNSTPAVSNLPQDGPPTLRPAPSDPLLELKLEAHAQQLRIEELEADLRAAEDQVHRLEAELRIRNTRIAEMQRADARGLAEGAAADEAATPSLLSTTPDMAALFAAADASREAARDEGQVSADVPALNSGYASVEREGDAARQFAEGSARMLVLMDGDTEVVHLLGRRTTLGRGSENDIQVDQQFVSRHHALIIAGPTQTVIEDLRSTNGLSVNGQRIRRGVLVDGDVILIGKTQFRFARRRS